MSIQIVPIAEQHIDSFYVALDEVARERLYLSFLEAPPLDASREFVRRRIAAGDPGMVALVGEEVVGWCDITRNARAIYAHAGVLGMGIVASHRGSGLGARLMRATLAQAWASGFTRVELTVRANNIRARRLYEREGFQLEGEMVNAVLMDGKYENVFFMALMKPCAT